MRRIISSSGYYPPLQEIVWGNDVNRNNDCIRLHSCTICTIPSHLATFGRHWCTCECNSIIQVLIHIRVTSNNIVARDIFLQHPNLIHLVRNIFLQHPNSIKLVRDMYLHRPNSIKYKMQSS